MTYGRPTHTHNQTVTQQTFRCFLRPQIKTNFEFSVIDFSTITLLLSNDGDLYIVNFYDIYKRLQNTKRNRVK